MKLLKSFSITLTLLFIIVPILLLAGCVASSGLGLGLGILAVLFFYVLVPVFFIVLIAFLIRWIIRTVKEQPQQQKDENLEIAKERYAKGEISKEEFEQLKKDLS